MHETIKQLLVEGHFEKALSRFDELPLSRGQRDELLILRSHVNEYESGIMTMSEDYRQRLRANIVKEGFRLINQVEDAEKLANQPPLVPPTPAAAAVPVHTSRTVAGVKKRNQSWILIGAVILGLVLMLWAVSGLFGGGPEKEPEEATAELAESGKTEPDRPQVAQQEAANVPAAKPTINDLKIKDRAIYDRLLDQRKPMGVLLYGTMLNRRTNLLQAQRKLVGKLNNSLSLAQAASLELDGNFHNSSAVDQLLKAETSSLPSSISQDLILVVSLSHPRSSTGKSTFTFHLYDRQKSKYILSHQSRTFQIEDEEGPAKYMAEKADDLLKRYLESN